MTTDQWEIRLVRQLDNHVLAQVLRDVLIEMNVPKQGTAFADPELDAIYDTYLAEKANYWVVCLVIIFWEVQVLRLCVMARLGIVSYRKCIFIPKQEERGWGIN